MEAPAAPTSKMAGFSRPKAHIRPEGNKLGQNPKDVAQSLDDLKSVAETHNVQRDPEVKIKAPDPEASVPETATDNEVEDSEIPAVLTYEEKVGEFGLTIESALAIVDSLTMEGVYTEKVKIGRKVKVEFSTRPTRFNTFLTDVIDQYEPKKLAKLNQIMSEYQLAASLFRYGDMTFDELEDGLSAKDWDAVIEGRLKFIRSLPTQLFAALCDKLSMFDLKMTMVFSKGYDEYF
jgi:hypothetical protein